MEITDEQIIIEVFQKFGTVIEKQGKEFIVIDTDVTPDHKKVKEINMFIKSLRNSDYIKAIV